MSAAHLARFASGAMSLDHPRGSGLAAAAVLALLAISPVHAGSPAQSGAYSAIVHEVQAAADKAFGAGTVVVLDRTAPSSTEFQRVSRASGHAPGQVRALLGDGTGSYGFAQDRVGCVVIGEKPSATPDVILQAAGVSPGPSDVTWEDAQRWALTIALGNCQIKGGMTPQQGAAFATLATTAASHSKALPGLLARYVEIKDTVEEPASAQRGAAVASAARFAVRSPAAPTGYGAMVAKAKTISPTDSTASTEGTFVEGMSKAYTEGPYYVPAKEGAVATDVLGWLHAYADVPGFSRAVAVLDDYRAGRFDKVPDAPRSDRGWADAMRTAAAQGDAVAAFMVDAPRPSVGSASSGPEPTRSASTVNGTLIPFDRDTQHISFEDSRFTISDADGNEVANGSHDKGIEETVHPGPRP